MTWSQVLPCLFVYSSSEILSSFTMRNVRTKPETVSPGSEPTAEHPGGVKLQRTSKPKSKDRSSRPHQLKSLIRPGRVKADNGVPLNHVKISGSSTADKKPLPKIPPQESTSRSPAASWKLVKADVITTLRRQGSEKKNKACASLLVDHAQYAKFSRFVRIYEVTQIFYQISD